MDGKPNTAKLPRREQNKSDKLRRIKAAARELFLSQSYEEATMREIARRADVGLGTLFSYASDKRDLLFLIYNDELQLATSAGFEHVDPGKSILANVVEAFSDYYRFFAEEPTFMRHVLREITFYSTGREAPRIQQGREMIIAGLAAMIVRAKDTGDITSKAGNRPIAEIIFAIYQAEVRLWLANDNPDPRQGLKALRAALKILIEGLRP